MHQRKTTALRGSHHPTGGRSLAGAHHDLAQMVLDIHTGSFSNPGGSGQATWPPPPHMRAEHAAQNSLSGYGTVLPAVISGQRPTCFRHPATKSQSSFLAKGPSKVDQRAEEEENGGAIAEKQ